MKNNFEEWCEKHRVLFCFLLFVIGILIGIIQSVLLSAPLDGSIKFGFIYSFIFIAVELNYDYGK